MAFTYCTNCGEKIDINETRCPHCGYVISHSGSYTYGYEEYNGNNNESSNPNGQGFNPNGQSFNNGQGFNPNGQNFNPLYRVPVRPQKRPISVGLAVFSILNIVFGCCTLPSFVFGIIALVITVLAQSASTEAEETAKKKIALILNIVGLVLSVIAVISFVAMFYDALLGELVAAGAAGTV